MITGANKENNETRAETFRTTSQNNEYRAISTSTIEISILSTITIKGVVHNSVISSSTVRLKNIAGSQIGETISDEDGIFSIIIPSSEQSQCLLLEASGGTVEGEDYEDVLTATYCSLIEQTEFNIIHNYLSSQVNQPQEVANKLNILNKSDIKSLKTSSTCLALDANGACWQDRNRDDFSFNNVWTFRYERFLNKEFGIDAGVDTASKPFLLTVSPPFGENVVRERAFVLRSDRPRIVQTLDESKIPVLFIHGFIPDGNLGGFKFDKDNSLNISGEYFGAFPRLVKDSNLDGKQYQPFLFQWRTNVPFEVAAHNLGVAIELIAQTTGRKVHVVAHSFGGVLSRVLIQGMAMQPVNGVLEESAYNSVFAEQNIASLTTIGSPHSGIFASGLSTDDRTVVFNKQQLIFPDGTSGIAGELIRACEAVTCHQMGAVTNDLLNYRWQRCSPSTGEGSTVPTTGPQCENNDITHGRDAWFGIHDNKGTIVHQLRAKLMSVGWPDIKTQVLFGLVGGIAYNAAGTGLASDVKGDTLISIEGQRFHASDELSSNGFKPLLTGLSTNSAIFPNDDKIQEHFLGFQEFNEHFVFDINEYRNFTNYYLENIIGDVLLNITNIVSLDLPEKEYMTIKRIFRGYNHRTNKYLADTSERMASEVGLQECTNLTPDECLHNSWQYFSSFMSVINSDENVVVNDSISITGFISNLDQVVGSVDVVVDINGSLADQYTLQGGALVDFKFDIRFVPHALYSIRLIPNSNSQFNVKEFNIVTEWDLSDSQLSLALDEFSFQLNDYQAATISLAVFDENTISSIAEYSILIRDTGSATTRLG